MGQKEINDLCIGILEGVRDSYLPQKPNEKCIPAENLLKPEPFTDKPPVITETRKVYDSDDNESDCSLMSQSSVFGGNNGLGISILKHHLL